MVTFDCDPATMSSTFSTYDGIAISPRMYVLFSAFHFKCFSTGTVVGLKTCYLAMLGSCDF